MLQADFHRGVPVVMVELVHPADPNKRKRGLGIIDTGASHSAIDRVVAEDLDLDPMGGTTMDRYDHENEKTDTPLFGVQIEILSLGTYRRTALGLYLAKYEAVALIGNDLLRMMKLCYDGPQRSVTLSPCEAAE